MPSLLERTLNRLQDVPVNANIKQPDQGLTVGQFLLEQLAAWGVKRIYGVIGDANLHFLNDIAMQKKIQYIPFLNENAAALAASAEAKLTGRVGVVLGTSGPGLTNMLNGLADAYADQTGVLAITGQVDLDKMGPQTKQYIPQQLMISPLAECSELLADPNMLPATLHRFLVASTVKGSVTHLSVPKSMFQEKVKGVVTPYSAHLHQPLLAPSQDVEETFRLVAAAKRPMFVYGRGVDEMADTALELAEAFGAAVAVTMPAKHTFPNNHELFVGGLGLAGSEASSVLMAESDMIVMFGATWWPGEFLPPTATVVQIDAIRENIGMAHPLARGLVGDLRQIMPEWLRLTKERQGGSERKGGSGSRLSENVSGPDEAWRQRIREIRGEWLQRVEDEVNQDGVRLAPQRIFRMLEEVVPPNAIIVLDTGDHTLWFNRIFNNRGQQVLISGRWRTLGFALPAAIAAQLEHPDRPVIAIAGDGGSVQTLMEFKTAVSFQLPVTMIVLNNGAYAIEKNRMEASGLSQLGSGLDNPDFAGIAKACGGFGKRVESIADFRAAVAEAMDAASGRANRQTHTTPTLIEVVTVPVKLSHSKA